ncbi:unnamed protein product, partial [Discosporangium mesarthrocarpum]
MASGGAYNVGDEGYMRPSRPSSKDSLGSSSASPSGAALRTPDFGNLSPPTLGDGRIIVACRVRPVARPGEARCVSVGAEACTVSWTGGRTSAQKSTAQFTFDFAAGEGATQEEVFEKVGRPVTDTCLEGFNGTIFCYGQTGSGKTFTTFGPPPTPLEHPSQSPHHLRKDSGPGEGVHHHLGQAPPHSPRSPDLQLPGLKLPPPASSHQNQPRKSSAGLGPPAAAEMAGAPEAGAVHTPNRRHTFSSGDGPPRGVG